MKNTFAISQQEERRIKILHESYKTNHGTGKLLSEADYEGEVGKMKSAIDDIVNNYETLKLNGIDNPNDREYTRLASMLSQVASKIVELTGSDEN